jgi:FixJ family two-component response regulator
LICVVDDDASVRRALKRLIRSCGFDVETYASGEDFFADAGAEVPQCLILDIHITGMTGFELCRKLTVSGSSVPVIFITAYDDEQTRSESKRFQPVAFLRKPFDDKTLIDAINQALRTA